MKKDMNRYASELTRDVYEKWKEFGRPEYGFKTFVTSIRKNPPFLIIGYNPGVGRGNSFKDRDLEKYENGDFSPPGKDENEILNREYKLAEKLSDVIFQDRKELLEHSVKYDLFFFRSSEARDLKEELGEHYEEAKSFCYEKTENIVENINPDYILVYGSTTFRKLKENFEDFEEVEKPLKNSRNHKYYRHGEWKGKDVFGIAHPTGGNNESNENLRNAADKMFKEIQI